MTAIAELRAAYAAGETTPAQVVVAAFDRAAAPAARPAWISLADREAAVARAAEVDLELPLGGVPFAVKDNIDVAGTATTAACPGFAYVPAETAPVVQLLLAAGAVLVGKTNLDQFATGLVGTRSPYGAPRSVADPRFVSGGSSSGSAVVVADGTVAFSLGTDTAGSGRVPAAFNGIAGLKPTRGLLSTRGVVPACRSLDCVSIFTSDVAGSGAVLAVVADYDREDARARPAPERSPSRWPPVIGVPAALDGLDARYAAHWRRAIDRAAELGAVVEVDIAPFTEAAALLYDGPWLAERWAAVGAAIEAELDGLDPVVAAVLARGRDIGAVAAFRAHDRLMELRRAAAELYATVDVVLLPTTPTIPTPAEVAAEPVEVNRRLGRWTNGVNLLDLCALALPAGLDPPFGVSLIGPAFTEERLLALGAVWTGEAPAPPARAGGIEVAVVGAHLGGQPLNARLTTRGARLVRAARTAPGYRLVELPGGPPERPGMVHAPGLRGPGIDVEIWSLGAAALGGLMAEVPAPLCIGTVELDDGSAVLGFLCEGYATAGAPDITRHGGWRAWLASRDAATVTADA